MRKRLEICGSNDLKRSKKTTPELRVSYFQLRAT